MSTGAALMTGAILVVSGPTVIAPLLRFIRPTERLRRVPASLSHLVLPTLRLVAVLVLITRPLVALLATLTSGKRENSPGGWPRATSSRRPPRRRLSAQLAAKHVGGASTILPVTFLVIVATVARYGLAAVPVARRVGGAGAYGRPSRRATAQLQWRPEKPPPAAGRRDWLSHPMLYVCEPGTLIGRTDRRTRGGISQPPSSSAPYRRVWGQTRPLFTLSPLT
jgi:hypothetical protein